MPAMTWFPLESEGSCEECPKLLDRASSSCQISKIALVSRLSRHSSEQALPPTAEQGKPGLKDEKPTVPVRLGKDPLPKR